MKFYDREIETETLRRIQTAKRRGWHLSFAALSLDDMRP